LPRGAALEHASVVRRRACTDLTKHQAQASRAQCLEVVAHHALAPAHARVLVAFGHPDAPTVPGIREGYENAHAWVRVFHCPELKMVGYPIVTPGRSHVT
jgi:hypothetical protein